LLLELGAVAVLAQRRKVVVRQHALIRVPANKRHCMNCRVYYLIFERRNDCPRVNKCYREYRNKESTK
jgi:hypothetical protein